MSLKPDQRPCVPLLSSTLRFLGLRPVQLLRRWAREGRVTLERKKGYILRAILLDLGHRPAGPVSSTNRADFGTKYTYREQLDDAHTVIDLKRLDGSRGGLTYAPLEMQPVFLAVVLDCLA